MDYVKALIDNSKSDLEFKLTYLLKTLSNSPELIGIFAFISHYIYIFLPRHLLLKISVIYSIFFEKFYSASSNLDIQNTIIF